MALRQVTVFGGSGFLGRYVVQHLAHDRAAGRLPRLHVLLRAVREVASPVAAGVLIIVTVFLPLLTLQNLEGKFFVPVALTIVFALAGSLLLSLTVIPVVASFLIHNPPLQRPSTVHFRGGTCCVHFLMVGFRS